MDWTCVKRVLDSNKSFKYPFTARHEFFLMVEVESTGPVSEQDPNAERLLNFIESVSDHTTDGVIPQDNKQAHSIWAIREGVAPASGAYGYTLKFDVTLPQDCYYDLIL